MRDVFRGDQGRSIWSRTDGDLLINNPNQLVWLGPDNLVSLLQQNAPAERLAVTTRATSLITGPLTAAPMQLVDDATGLRSTPRWLADPMLLRADARMVDGLQAFPHARRLTRSRFWAEILRSAIWYGYGAFVYQPSAGGAPIPGTMRQLNPLAVEIDRSSCWTIGVGDDRVTFDRDGSLEVGPVTYRIAAIRNPLSPVYDDGSSHGVFDLTPSAFDVAASVDGYTRGTFRAGVPSGYLKVSTPGFNDTQAAQLKAKWLGAHGNDERSIAVLGATVDFEPISYNPVDTNAAGIKQLSVADVAFAFGLPPEVLGVSMGGSGTYQNLSDGWSRLKAFGLAHWIAELEDMLSSLVPVGQSVRLDLSEYDADMTTSTDTATTPTAPAAPTDPTDPADPTNPVPPVEVPADV